MKKGTIVRWLGLMAVMLIAVVLLILFAQWPLRRPSEQPASQELPHQAVTIKSVCNPCTYFFPVIGTHLPIQPILVPGLPLREPVNKRFGVGWWADSQCCVVQQTILGIGLGYIHDYLDAQNPVQMFQYSRIAATDCSYDLGARQLYNARACGKWIADNNYYGKYWIIGNEPDWVGVSLENYVAMWRAVDGFLQGVDPTVKLITTAWAGEERNAGPGAFVKLYRDTYGEIPRCYAWGFHQYHYYTQPITDNETSFLRWQDGLNRDIPGHPLIWITEFGWDWSTPCPTENDCIQYMREFVSWLLRQPQVDAWFWWRDSGALVSGNQITILGQCYKNLAHGDPC